MKSFFACLPLLALSVIATPVTNLVKRESVTVHFIETATTYFGENIFVVGGINELGNWNTDNAIALSPSNYPDWDTYVSFPANTRFEYKFIRKAPNGAVTWEFDPLGANRVFTTGSSGTATVSSSFDNRGTTVSQSNGGGGGGSDGTVEGDFSLLATTYYGENIYLAGSIDALGNWDTSRALLLSAADYPTWKISVDLPASTSFEFKFFRLGSDGSITWEFNSQGAAGNRKATTPSSGTFFFSATFNGEATVSTSTSMSSTTTTTMSSTTTSTTTSTTPTLTSTSTTTSSTTTSTTSTTPTSTTTSTTPTSTSTTTTSTTLTTPTVTVTSTVTTPTITTPSITTTVTTPTVTVTSTITSTPTTTSTITTVTVTSTATV